jgi:hypothetical protein
MCRAQANFMAAAKNQPTNLAFTTHPIKVGASHQEVVNRKISILAKSARDKTELEGKLNFPA